MAVMAADAVGPVVRMCDVLDCRGYLCSNTRPDAFMGMSFKPPCPERFSDEGIAAYMAQELSLNYVVDDAGMKRMVPDGCEFTVHKGTDSSGAVVWSAIYSGDAPDKSAVLAGSPEWDWDAAVARMRRMRAEGFLDALLRDEERQRQQRTPQRPTCGVV